MGLKDQLRQLRREARKDAVLLKLKDGTTRVFSDMEVYKEMILTQFDLYKGEARESEVLDAVRQATPESRQAFEREYGSIQMEARIIAGAYEGAWVEVHRLLEDGTVESTYHEGGSEEAERLRREAREQGPAS